MRFGLREILFVLVLLAMPAVAYVFVFQANNKLQQDARSDNNAKRAQLAALQQATDRYVDLDDEIARLEFTIDLIEQKLPKGPEEYAIIRNITDLALSHGLTIRSVKPDKVVPAAQYMELPVRLEIEGDFTGFYTFLLEVERLPRITQMPVMTLEKLDGDDEAEGAMIAKITLSSFFESE